MTSRLGRRLRRNIAVTLDLLGKATGRGRRKRRGRAGPAAPLPADPEPGLAGRRVVVTGGNRGIGLAVARGLAAQGCRVAILSRSAAEGEAAASAIGGGAFAVAADLTRADQVGRAFAEVADRLGGIDILINNAGIAEAGHPVLADLPDTEFMAVLDANLGGAFRAAQAALRVMLPQGHGRIINVSTGAVERPQPGHSAYAVSKHGLEGLTMQLAAEAAASGIVVTTLRLGSVHTGMTERTLGTLKASLLPEPDSLLPAFIRVASAPAALVSGRSLSAWRLLADAEAELHTATPIAQVPAFTYPVYVHNGRTVARTDTDFTIYDRAENHYGAAPEVMAALGAATTPRLAAVYPDETHGALRAALAARMRLDSDCFAIGNGSWEILDRLLEMLTRPGDKVVSARPGWFGFNMLVGKRALDATMVPLRRTGAGFEYDLDAVAAAVGPATRLIYLISPSNPEGVVLKKAGFARFLAMVPDSIPILLDEAYAEYVDDPEAVTARDLIDTETRPILGLRTFSKFYALAGARVGYAYGRPEHVEWLKRGERIFSISRLSEVAATAALGATAHQQHIFDTTTAERRRMAGALTGLGLDVVPSQAPFMLVELPDTLTRVVEVFAEEGIYLGEKAFYKQRYFLLPISTPEENSRNLAILARLAGRGPAAAAAGHSVG